MYEGKKTTALALCQVLAAGIHHVTGPELTEIMLRNGYERIEYEEGLAYANKES